MPALPLSSSLSFIQSALAVERLRRRELYTAAGLDFTAASDHLLSGTSATTSHRVVCAIRRAAGSARVVRPVDACLFTVSGARVQWALLHVPAARVPAGLVWAALGTSGQLEMAAPLLAAPIAHAPSASLDRWLQASITAASAGMCCTGECGAQSSPLAVGDALILVAARYGAVDTTVLGFVRAEVCDE